MQINSLASRGSNSRSSARSGPQKKNVSPNRTEDRPRQQLAREVQARAAKGLFSVAPLFNEPANQVGELVLLEGTVRRVTRVDVGKTSDGAASDVARRFGIDHYYELDLFTDDSQNNPIVVCVRELPPGFPVGDGLHEPVRVAGLFFKSWSFESRRATLPIAPDGSATPAATCDNSPRCVIGRGPVLLEVADASTTAYASYDCGGVFVAAAGHDLGGRLVDLPVTTGDLRRR